MKRLAAVVYLVIAVLAFMRVRRVGFQSFDLGDAAGRRVGFLLVGVAALALVLDKLGIPPWILLAGVLWLLWRSGLLRWGLAELGLDVPGPWLSLGDGAGDENGVTPCPAGTLCLDLWGNVTDRTGGTA